jgi:hypothetical protein
MTPISNYRHVWAVDFEFTAPPGDRPTPICCVARDVRSGALVRTWLADGAPSAPPYDVGAGSLFLAYYASAELACHLVLDWPMPARVVDLYAEFRNLTSGLTVPCGHGLLGALAYHGLDALDAAEKDAMRQLAVRGGPFTAAQGSALLDYCQSDVDALAILLPAMLPKIDLPRALLRGRYMAAAARMESIGVPIDVEELARLRENWAHIKARLIAAVNADTHVFTPAGQPPLRLDTPFGAAVFQEAEYYGIDPYTLAEAARYLWNEEHDRKQDYYKARRAARKATGLTPRAMDLWIREGHDGTTWPRLDVKAQSLANEFPELNIGPRFDMEVRADAEDSDPASRLWEMLNDGRDTMRPRHDPELLRQAAEMIERAGPTADFRTMVFSSERFAAYLASKGIPWPRLPSGALALDDDSFREMARAYPNEISPIRELRHALSQLRINELAVGADGSNRVLLSAFSSRTGRNAPSSSKFVFGPATWLRSLIKPGPGRAVAYVDWSQQELAIAAALSGDRRMQAAYKSGDFYLAFATIVVPVEHGSNPLQRQSVEVHARPELDMQPIVESRKNMLPLLYGQGFVRWVAEQLANADQEPGNDMRVSEVAAAAKHIGVVWL